MTKKLFERTVQLMDTDQLEKLKEKLNKYSESDLALFIPKQILHLSDQQRQTVEFVFWFCHVVERDLNLVLKMSAKATSDILGKMTPEEIKWANENYGINLVKVDPDHPDYDPKDISFGDQIFFSEKLRGKTPLITFQWKVKKIRDDLSHGRIKDLSYNGESLYNVETKRKILSDYVTLMNNVESEELGGFAGELSEEEWKEIATLQEKKRV